MPKLTPSNISSITLQIPQNSKEIGKILLKRLKINNNNKNNTGVAKTGTIIEEFDLGPIEDHMENYRKGFSLRSMDGSNEFDKIIHHGYGTRNNQCDYTLKISLTPSEIRNP